MRTNRSIRRIVTAAAVAGAFSLFPPAAGFAKHLTPTPSPSPSPVADPAITLIARQQFVQWQAGVVNRNLYAPEVQPKLTAAKIGETSGALAQLGALTSTVYIGRWINPDFPSGAHGYIYQMRCVSGNVYLWLALQGDGKIATIFFKSRLDVENVTPAPSATPPNPL